MRTGDPKTYQAKDAHTLKYTDTETHRHIDTQTHMCVYTHKDIYIHTDMYIVQCTYKVCITNRYTDAILECFKPFLFLPDDELLPVDTWA